MITEKNTSPRKAFRSAPKSVEQDASLENASCSDSKEEQAVLSGVKPVLELLEREPERIDAVLVRKGKRSQDTDRILDLCRTAKVRFTLADAQSLDRLCPPGIKGSSPGFSRPVSPSSPICSRTLRTLPCRSSLCLIRCGTPATPEPSPARYTRWAGPGWSYPATTAPFWGPGRAAPQPGALERLPVAKVMNIARGAGRGTGRGIPHLRGRVRRRQPRRLHHPSAYPRPARPRQ